MFGFGYVEKNHYFCKQFSFIIYKKFNIMAKQLKPASGKKTPAVERKPLNLSFSPAISKILGCKNCPLSASRLRNIPWQNFIDVPTWWFDEATKTLCLNGNMELPTDYFDTYQEKLDEIIQEHAHENQIVNIYLGPTFYVEPYDKMVSSFINVEPLKIYVARANQHFYSTGDGMLLSKDGKKLYSCPKDATNVVVPDGVEIIDDSAFSDCRSLQEVKLPDSVLEIKHHGFLHCYKLASITLPDKLTAIGYGAFSHCGSIKSLKIPRGVKEIEGQTFRECKSMTDIYLPKGIKIDELAFLYINPTIHYY